jgi:hypothetical protein
VTRTEPTSAVAVRRWAVIAAAGLSGVLVMISMFVDPAPSANGRELIAAYAGDTFASGLHTNLIHYGFVLIAPVVYVMVGMVRGRGAWLANVAALLAVVGLSTLPGLVMLDLTSTAAAQVTDIDTAFAIEEQLGQSPAFVFLVIPAFLGAVVALPVAVVAMWRAGLVRGIVAVAAVAAALAPNVAPTWWLGFGINAVWMLGLGYVLWRLPMSAWSGGAEATGTAGQGERVAAH